MKVYQVNEAYKERKFFKSKRDADKYYIDLFLDGKQIEEKEYDLKKNESIYRVHINSCDIATEFNALVCVAKSEYQARAIGNQYIRAWNLNERIIKIAEVEIN